MHRSRLFRALLLASAAIFPLQGMAQPVFPASHSGTGDAIRVLLEQATYWHGKYDTKLADEAIARVLTLDPRNPDALAIQAQAAADRGDQQSARAALQKLQSVRPDDPRVAPIQQALLIGPLDQAALAQARKLASEGKASDAVAAYRRVFKGDTPPPGLALEYFQTLGSVDGEWDTARQSLANMVRADPQDLRVQLAFAEALTYHEGTRADGIDRLAALSQLPSIARAVTPSWRNALLWSTDDQRSQSQLDAYLQQNPSDPALDAKRVEFTSNLPDAGMRARLAGYSAMQNGELAQADKAFGDALAFNANDVDAMAMLALIRRQQGKEAQSKALVARIEELAPDRRDELIAATGLDKAPAGPAARATGNAGLAVRRQYEQVAALTKRGEFAAAEAQLRRVMGSHPTAGNELQLGDIQARAGELAEADATFRAVLRAQPRNVAALGGLAGVLTREGKTAEAEAMYAQAERNGGGAAVGQARAQLLRQQAQSVSDPAVRCGLFRAAVNADPANPWLRLELARALFAQNDTAEAHSVMAAVTETVRPTADQLRAGIYFAESSKDYGLASALVSRLPARDRTADLRDVQLRADAAADVQDARAQGSVAAMRQRMLEMASKPDPTGARASGFARDLIAFGDKAGAREVIRAALAVNQPALPAQRLAYAGALVGAGFPRDAQLITSGLQSARLSPAEQAQLTAVRDSVAVVAADTLNGRGKPADAFDELAPRLAKNPQNPTLNLALARLYAAHDQPGKAVGITESLLKRDPGNLDIKVAAIGVAVQAGDLARAGQLAAQVKQQFPDEPQAFLAAAQAERARDENGAALRDLQTAKALRAKQVDQSTSDAAATMPPGWRPYRQYALNIAPGTLSDVSEPLADEPVTREYERYADNLPPASDGDVTTNPPVPAWPNPFRQPSPAQPTAVDLPAGSAAAHPVQIAQGGLDTPTYVNPFREGAGLTPDEPSAASRPPLAPPSPRAPADPLTADIDRNIRQVSESLAPRVEGSLTLRGRSGADGLAQLFDLETPVEASFSPAGAGRFKVVVTPTVLYAGSASQTDRSLFGTNPLIRATGARLAGLTTNAAGAGLDVGYAYGPLTADAGTTPLGFRVTNVVGGVQYAPKLSQNLTLQVLGERRAVTDSLLSFAGARDPRSGQGWGGVTRDRGHIQLQGSAGLVSYYAGAGAGALYGEQVKNNAEVDAGAGFSLPVYRTATQEVRVGLDLVYFAYQRNLGGFTIGNGGYFSPQQFFAAVVPVTYRDQVTPDLSYTVGGSLGLQTFRAKSQLLFPTDPALQAQINSLASTNNTVATRLGGFSDTGPAGGANGAIDYRVTDNLHVGAKAGFDRSGNYTEGTGLVYARYLLYDRL